MILRYQIVQTILLFLEAKSALIFGLNAEHFYAAIAPLTNPGWDRV